MAESQRHLEMMRAVQPQINTIVLTIQRIVKVGAPQVKDASPPDKPITHFMLANVQFLVCVRDEPPLILTIEVAGNGG